MCRMLAYAGPPVLLDELLVKPDSSLVHQVIEARMLAMLNLAGFGLAAWDDAMADPAVYALIVSSTVIRSSGYHPESEAPSSCFLATAA